MGDVADAACARDCHGVSIGVDVDLLGSIKGDGSCSSSYCVSYGPSMGLESDGIACRGGEGKDCCLVYGNRIPVECLVRAYDLRTATDGVGCSCIITGRSGVITVSCVCLRHGGDGEEKEVACCFFRKCKDSISNF